MRSVEAGALTSLPDGRRGRRTSSPPQLGHLPASGPSAHATQKVHSNEQMRASRDSGGRSLLQHSQLGRRSNMAVALVLIGLSAIKFDTELYSPIPRPYPATKQNRCPVVGKVPAFSGNDPAADIHRTIGP
jgi:hypothetical protein